jgi:hypothetical protein
MLIKDRHTMPSGAEDRHARRLVPGRSDNERGGSRPVREVSANHKDNHFFNLDKFGTVDSGEDPDELVADVPGALEADSKKEKPYAIDPDFPFSQSNDGEGGAEENGAHGQTTSSGFES